MTATDTREHSDYLAYLLRLWPEDNAERIWRASLESVSTGERRGFANLDDLINYLRKQTETPAEPASLTTTENKEVTDPITTDPTDERKIAHLSTSHMPY